MCPRPSPSLSPSPSLRLQTKGFSSSPTAQPQLHACHLRALFFFGVWLCGLAEAKTDFQANVVVAFAVDVAAVCIVVVVVGFVVSNLLTRFGACFSTQSGL